VRYVYFDVVDFTKSRSIEAQTDILLDLNRIVAEVISGVEGLIDQAILLPAGDGVCICLVNTIRPYDLDIRIALDVLDRLFLLRKEKIDQTRQFEVRVGLNENQDNLIVDSRGCSNVVGLGINTAQRIMSVAGPSRLMLGSTVFERLSQRESYQSWIRPAPAIVKHGQRLRCYEFFNPALRCFSGSTLRSAQMPPSNPAGGRIGNDVVSLPLDSAPVRQSKRPTSKTSPSFKLSS